MKIKTDLIKEHIADVVCSQLTDFEIDEKQIADTKATMALSEIQHLLTRDELTDFEIIEEIVRVFIKYKLDYGTVHDF